ncbi:hypothetical protein EDB87DRAFT_1564975, partial [Lactarius vividus]
TRVALVTGAPRGIGRTIALRLAEDGFDVTVNDVLPNWIIENKGRCSLGVPADVSLEPEVERMVQEVMQDLGSLDMVANAGITAFESFLNVTVESFDRLMAVNTRGTMSCYEHSTPRSIRPRQAYYWCSPPSQLQF